MDAISATGSMAVVVSPPVAGNVEDDLLRPSSTAAPRAGTTQPADPASTIELPGVGRVGLALVVVVAGILLLRALARRFVLLPGGVKSNKAVRVLSRSILAPKQHVVLLQVGKRIIVVGDSCGRLSPLCEIGDPDEVASLTSQVQNEKAEPIAPGFEKVFGRATETFAPDPDGEADETSKADSVTAATGGELADLGLLVERVRSMQQQLR